MAVRSASRVCITRWPPRRANHADTLDIIRMVLEDAGAIVSTAASAREGLETLQRERPALLLSDIAMPEHTTGSG